MQVWMYHMLLCVFHFVFLVWILAIRKWVVFGLDEVSFRTIYVVWFMCVWTMIVIGTFCVYFILCFGFGFLLFASELCFSLEVRHHLEQIMLFDLCLCGNDSYRHPTWQNIAQN
jgi:hypothetical protein